MSKHKSDHNEGHVLTDDERKEISNLVPPRAAVIYEVVREEGEDELARSTSALAWSGFAAGMSIGLSMISEGLLAAYLPDTAWSPLLENFGYCVGFVVVILGRQQLFTENTITVVLPFLKAPSLPTLLEIARLWSVVLSANMAGCLAVAAFVTFSPAFPERMSSEFIAIGEHLMHNDFAQMLAKGVVAGWLIATLVWLMPMAEGSAEVWLIVIITYLIAVGDLTHIVAGSVEVFTLWLAGHISLWHAATGFMLPTLAGNVLGGTALFALLSYAQVHDEIK